MTGSGEGRRQRAAVPPGTPLGPPVVGSRVVVRRLTGRTAPSGRPEMTDVIGVCVAWSADTVTVRRDGTGVLVRLPLAEVVAGKTLPAPHPLKVPAADAERHALTVFPRLEIRPLGWWLLRAEPAADITAFGRARRRANSCLTLGDPGVPIAEAADAVCDFYAARNRPALAQVLAGGETEAGLRGLGWSDADGEAHFEVAILDAVRRNAGPGSGLPATTGPDRYTVDTDAVRGEAVLDDDWVGLHGLWTAPEQRRRGRARAVVADLAAWAAGQGARVCWLQVETDNDAALDLYAGLGFRIHHTTRYLAAPARVTGT